MGSYISDSLGKKEVLIKEFGHHWFAWVPMYVWLLLAIPSLGLTLLLAGWHFLWLRSLERGVTNKRFIQKTGVISRDTKEIKVSAIETVTIKQGIFGRIFGSATLVITGRGITDIQIKYVPDPMQVKKEIEAAEDWEPEPEDDSE